MLRALLAAFLGVLVLGVTLPADGTQAAAPRTDTASWQARQIGAAASARQQDRELLRRLPGRARVGYHPETGRVRMLSGTHRTPLSDGLVAVAAGQRRLSAADARARARDFLGRYGRLFGLRDASAELRIVATQRRLTPGRASAPRAAGNATRAVRKVAAGRPHASVRFEQVRGGVPVIGGELVVQLSEAGEVVSVAGEVLPAGSRVGTRPSIGRGRARREAATWLAREARRAPSLVRARSEGLGLYDGRLVGDPFLETRGARLVWRIDARLPASGARPADHRLVLVDALGGGVLTSIGRLHDADRRVCDNRNQAGKAFRCDGGYARSEGDPLSRLAEVDAAYRNMGAVLDYFEQRFDRDGIDDQGSEMKATVRYCPSYGCPWRNAQWHWADQQAVFGSGWAKADDIVAHEFTHGVLDHEAPLLYIYQSGAINESYADIFGELIDQWHPAGTDTAASRWKIGEDTPIGVFRDMRDPRRHGHPDRVRSPLWHTAASDFGGVHRNSGVGNKAAYLISQGGTFRGIRIRGIGQTRTARVYYHALTTRLTSAANYLDLADALTSACADLVGQGVTAHHCKQVRKATRATQMHLKPRKFAPKTAPVCFNDRRPDDVLYDDLEDPDSDAWRPTRLAGTGKGWYYPQNPNNDPRWDGTWASSGDFNFYAPNRPTRLDSVMRLRQGVELPERAFLRFEHGFGFDKDGRRRYDGAIVQIRLDDGPWRGVGSLFTHGGYNGKVARGTGNRLAGKRAFTGSSHGWAQARIDLSDFAGQSLKVRFRMSSDKSVGGLGWYVDDVRIYRCVPGD